MSIQNVIGYLTTIVFIALLIILLVAGVNIILSAIIALLSAIVFALILHNLWKNGYILSNY